MSNPEPVKRYGIWPVDLVEYFEGSRRRAVVLAADYDRDIKALEAENKQLRALLKPVIRAALDCPLEYWDEPIDAPTSVADALARAAGEHP